MKLPEAFLCPSCGCAVQHHVEQQTHFCRHATPITGRWRYHCPECEHEWSHIATLSTCKSCSDEGGQRKVSR